MQLRTWVFLALLWILALAAVLSTPPAHAMTARPLFANVYVPPDVGSQPGGTLERLELRWLAFEFQLDAARGVRVVEPGKCYRVGAGKSAHGVSLHSVALWSTADGLVPLYSDPRSTWATGSMPVRRSRAAKPCRSICSTTVPARTR